MKKLVRKILEKYEVNTLTVKTLKNIINAQGYTVIFYSPNNTTNEPMRLIKTLGIDKEAISSNSFTYSNRDRRIVFIKEDLSDDELLYFLSLELGKILSSEVQTSNLLAQNTSDLIKAHEFAYHLTSSHKHGIVFHLIKYYPVQSVVSALILDLCLVVLLVFFILNTVSSNQSVTNNSINHEQSFIKSDVISDEISVPAFSVQIPEMKSDDDNNNISTVPEDIISYTSTTVQANYFATQNGKKYHASDCSYISGKQTVEVSQNDIDNGKYTPCSRCIG